MKAQIKNCKDLEQLRLLYKQHYNIKDLEDDFRLQKETIQSKAQLLNPKNFSQNGHTSHTQA